LKGRKGLREQEKRGKGEKGKQTLAFSEENQAAKIEVKERYFDIISVTYMGKN
jgi:hypothetical protein